MPTAFDPIAEGAIIRNKKFNPIEEGAILRENKVNPREQEASSNDIFKAPDLMSSTIFHEAQHPSPLTKAIGNTIMFGIAPEFKVTGALARKIPGIATGLINLISRGGANTLMGGAVNEFNKKEESHLNKFKEGTLEALPYVIGGEALTLPLRGVRSLAELINPSKYSNNKLADIKNIYQSAVGRQKEAYRPVFEKYGEAPLTNNPEEYLGFDKKMIKRFTPDVRQSYTDFLESPTFSNAHKLQSQLFTDSNRLADKAAKINTYQTLRNARKSVNEKIWNFLSSDSRSLSNYIKGTEITRDEVEPFRSTKYLQKILAGKIKEVDPKELASELKKGTEKLSGGIPEKHYLATEMKKLEEKINRGKLLPQVQPNIAHTLSPLPHSVVGAAQNPYLVKALEGLSKPYYTGLQGLMGYNINNQQQ